MKPKRIQRRRVKGWRMPPNTVYVGRGSKWGNPCFVYANKYKDHKYDLNPYCVLRTKEEAVEGFKEQLELLKNNDSPKCVLRFEYTDIKNELKGKDLCCWCPLDKPCHADVLLEIANKEVKK